MIFSTVLGNTRDDDGARLVAGSHIDRIMLSDQDLVKRVQRVTTQHGHEVGIRLPAGSPDLRDGDILCVEDGEAIIVSVLPTEVIVIKPRSITEMGFVAHSLGNRHLQAQFFDGSETDGPGTTYDSPVMVVQYDHTVADFLAHHEVPYQRDEKVMPVPFRHAEHSH